MFVPWYKYNTKPLKEMTLTFTLSAAASSCTIANDGNKVVITNPRQWKLIFYYDLKTFI